MRIPSKFIAHTYSILQAPAIAVGRYARSSKGGQFHSGNLHGPDPLFPTLDEHGNVLKVSREDE